jgi:hypothetical protein
MHFSFNTQSLLLACENGDLMAFAVDLSTSNRKCQLLFSMKTNQPKIVSLSHDFKEKYIFASFSDSSIGIYENVSHFKKALYFIDKVNFHNPVHQILNSFQKDNLIIGCKQNCVAFCNPQSLKSKFVLNVENTELNGFLFDSKKQILWTFGNDKTLRAWEISSNLFSKEGNKRLLSEWDKDKIFDALDLKTISHYTTQNLKGNIKKVEKENLISSNEDKFNDKSEESEESEDEIKESKNIIPQERNFKEDIKNIIPNFKKDFVQEENEGNDSEDENSAAKKYGLVKVNHIENLAVSNSENDSEEEGNRKEGRKVKRKKEKEKEEKEKENVSVKKKKEEKVESETESDDDLTGWF